MLKHATRVLDTPMMALPYLASLERTHGDLATKPEISSNGIDYRLSIYSQTSKIKNMCAPPSRLQDMFILSDGELARVRPSAVRSDGFLDSLDGAIISNGGQRLLSDV